MTRIVYLSRGHGHGHAAVDLEIVRGLRRRGVEVELASYGTGLDYFTARSEPCRDLGIDDIDDQGPDAALRVMAFLRSRAAAAAAAAHHGRGEGDAGDPGFEVVAHEIFTAPSICRALGLRNTLLTHWFFSEVGAPELDVRLEPVDSLLLLDFEAAHRVPDGLKSKAVFTGAVAQPIGAGRDEARIRLGIGDEPMVLVTTGASTPVNAAHLRAVVDGALAALRRTAARVVVLSGVRPQANGDRAMEWVSWTGEPGLYYRAADVVVANATFSTLCTLASNAVPAIAVTGGRNPVDRLHADFLTAQGLLSAIHVDELATALPAMVPTLLSAGTRIEAPDGIGRGLDWVTPDGIAARLASTC